MKSISAGLLTHLSETTTTLTTVWKLVRTDGLEFFFTDHDADIELDGDTYKALNGYNRTAVQNNASLAVDNVDIMGVFDDLSITETDIRAGLFDYCEIFIAVVNWEDLSQGILKSRRGHLGEVISTPQGYFRAEMRGMTQNLSQNIGEIFQAECRADLGDSRCQISIRPPLRLNSTGYSVGDVVRVATDGSVVTTIDGEPTQDAYENRVYRCTTAGSTGASLPVFDETIGALTVETGGAVFTAEDSWTRHATISSVTDQATFVLSVSEARAVDDWFNGGGFIFESGENAGFAIEIRDWVQSSNTITIFLPAPFLVTAGVKVRLYPGCDKRSETCSSRFSNILNFRGEPFIPGQDEITSYPDAQ